MEFVLSPIEARILGCLIEKGVTTPEYYPLTLNALTSACNQKSNRDPVMSLTDEDVIHAVDDMRYAKHLVTQVTAHGSRVPKYEHNLVNLYKFSPQGLGLLCVLLLRGPQTVGELRTRTSRLCEFTDLAQVETTLGELAEWGDGPFVTRLPRERGRREVRYAHLLCGEIPVDEAAPEAVPEPARRKVQAEDDRLASLEQDVAALRNELASIRAQFDAFREQFE